VLTTYQSTLPPGKAYIYIPRNLRQLPGLTY